MHLSSYINICDVFPKNYKETVHIIHCTIVDILMTLSPQQLMMHDLLNYLEVSPTLAHSIFKNNTFRNTLNTPKHVGMWKSSNKIHSQLVVQKCKTYMFYIFGFACQKFGFRNAYNCKRFYEQSWSPTFFTFYYSGDILVRVKCVHYSWAFKAECIGHY